MKLRFIGIDPDTGTGESPTLWVDESTSELIIQGWRSGPELEAECAAFGARQAAVHLEMRDTYGVDSEAEDFARWKATGHRDTDPGSPYWDPWVRLIRRTVTRGVEVRRVRIVSEPASDYIRYEHAGTPVNMEAGEQVRWLPRRRASDVALPGNDFWLIDGQLIRWNHFTGDGASAGGELNDDPATAKLCADAFEAVWKRAVPHEKYEIA